MIFTIKMHYKSFFYKNALQMILLLQFNSKVLYFFFIFIFRDTYNRIQCMQSQINIMKSPLLKDIPPFLFIYCK